MSTISIPVDARPEEVQIWKVLAKAAATTNLVNEAVSLAGLQGQAAPSTPGHYVALLQEYQATGGFPTPFTDEERQAIDRLIEALKDAVIESTTTEET